MGKTRVSWHISVAIVSDGLLASADSMSLLHTEDAVHIKNKLNSISVNKIQIFD